MFIGDKEILKKHPLSENIATEMSIWIDLQCQELFGNKELAYLSDDRDYWKYIWCVNHKDLLKNLGYKVTEEHVYSCNSTAFDRFIIEWGSEE